MYTPSYFKDEDLASLHGQIEATRLATLVTFDETGLQASHIPLLLEPTQGPQGTLYGHLAKANPQWKALETGAEALLIFQGADAYISPSFYAAKAEHGKVVPTWNYLAVHAYGRADVFTDPERLLRVVTGLTDKHEASRAEPWAVSDAPADYIEKMLNGIVGFAIPIERLEGKRKLNQNRSAADIAGVSKGLALSQDPSDQKIAQLMSQGATRV
ncbi:FMN-binding negative transcriptional regulator [Pseudomonas petrae]|uniref:FMN-binding negative transcriptional regulator n=1 Tax=Pseudomonas petrae TaxID=2912190 RepID=A0ABS9I105_9PSED|nr:FMN-binding negative transcriptional regulator [Pseudomonas petrae]MCF7531602.1 FMN-binding negative transcriptional regulator [Pseudomonas petrae]MCF7537165.1 FMN-binding negative transcriptional regulator [Pseudomonas petrae]MCF7540841.1 FMN-binding negative transcriptional regulator [Pseudomonas petrae]